MKTIIMLTCNQARIVVLIVLVIITLGMAGTVHAQETTKKIRLYKSWVEPFMVLNHR